MDSRSPTVVQATASPVAARPILRASAFEARLHYGPPAFGYALAVALVVVSGMGRLGLMSSGDFRAPFLLFYPAIALASFLGGIGPGLLALLLCALFAGFFFPGFPPPASWIAFSVVGPLMATGLAHLREVRDRSHATAREYTRFRFISDNASDWIFVLRRSRTPGKQKRAPDPDCDLIDYINQSAAWQLGVAPTQMAGRRLEDFVPEWQRPGLRNLLSTCESGSNITCDLTFERWDCSEVALEASCTAVRSAGEVVVYMAARDVTERRKMEEQLREAKKWESLGTLAGGLAHDFNNLLTSIIGNASLAREYLPEGHPVGARLANIEQAGERSAELVRLMLATAGHRQRQAETLPMHRILEQTLASHALPAHIRVQTEMEAPAFSADCKSIAMLLWNLISNAAEAYGAAPGEVSLRICACDPPALGPASFEEGVLGSARCLGIIVEDRGSGMTKEVLSRAFDPFFTTRFMGRGLGLPAVRGLVRAHGGKLWVRTRPGKGTRVEVWLPAPAAPETVVQ